MESALLSLMPHTITLAPYVSQNAYGESTWGAAVSYQARVQGKMKMIRDFTGVERVSTVTCYVATTEAISPKDKLTLPSSFVPQTPLILAVERQADEHGDHHVVIYA
jgi:hypothetical protein